MTVLELATFACDTVGDISAEALDFAKRAVRLKYQTLYDAHPWRESFRMLSSVPVDSTANGSIFLPYDCEEVIFLSLSTDGVNYTRLGYRERDWLERFGSSMVSPSSVPNYYRAENLAWPHLGPGKLVFTSYDTTLFVLFVSGLDANGNIVQETYKVQAAINPDTSTNPAVITTVNSFSQINVLSKGLTEFPLTIQAQFPPGLPLTAMPASVSASIYTQLVLYPVPLNLSNLFFRAQVKLKPDNLDGDYSVPRISHVTDGLVEFTLAALYKRGRQLTKADNCEQKAIAHIQAAVQIEKNQSESRQQVVPVIYEQGDYLGRETTVSSAYPFGY